MNRRELLGTVGALGAGLTVGAAEACADHGKKPDGVRGPVDSIHLHFCGIHVAKTNPRFQIITQHYCSPLGEEMHQCLLYDSLEKNARLLGVEYVISDSMYRKLPAAEKPYWHPHTYEVLGGGLVAPEMGAEAELAFMKALLTTWGKTWHTWPDPTTAVPLGEPLLMWALTGAGQEDKKVIAARDRQFGVNTSAIQKKRLDALGYELPDVPQPKTRDTVGRQWTAEGEDRPKRRRKKN